MRVIDTGNVKTVTQTSVRVCLRTLESVGLWRVFIKITSPLPELSLTSLRVRSRLRELVEYVEISLILNLTNHTTFLQEVIRDLGTNGLSMIIEHNFQIFSLYGVRPDA